LKFIENVAPIVILMILLLVSIQGWKNYEDLQDEAISRGHAVMHEGEFRWVNCNMKDFYK